MLFACGYIFYKVTTCGFLFFCDVTVSLGNLILTFRRTVVPLLQGSVGKGKDKDHPRTGHEGPEGE